MPKPVILAADDSVTVRKLIELSLKPDEFDLHFAVEGKECLAKAAELRPALLLLDYILPDMKGIDICHALLKRPETREIPVLLISGNGAAIRQTYENASNVADYLTKPFAPNVLNAVVGHLLADSARKKSEDAETQNLALTPVTTDATLAQISETTKSKIIRSIESCLQGPLMAFPGLEAGREGEPAEEYFLHFLSSSGAIEKLAAALLALPELKPAPVQLRCASELVPVDRVLHHLNEMRANGLLRLELVDEIVLLQLEAGEIVFITSNNPKRYCAGAAFPFRSVPQAAIAAAVAAQQNGSTPFFVTLEKAKALPAGTNPGAFLQTQGAAALARAVKAASARITFEDADNAEAEWRPFFQRQPLPGLLLAAYRSVDDWLTIEAAIPGFEMIFRRNADSGYRPGELKFDQFESELLSLVDGKRSVQDLVNITRVRPFDLCRRLFPLVKLELVLPAKLAGPRPGGREGFPGENQADTATTFTNGRFTPRNTRLAGHTVL